ncbi:MAG: hypothetical protein LZF84_00915, partial [Nitrosomonas sp.]
YEPGTRAVLSHCTHLPKAAKNPAISCSEKLLQLKAIPAVYDLSQQTCQAEYPASYGGVFNAFFNSLISNFSLPKMGKIKS